VVLSVCATAQARQQALACHFFLPSAILLPEPQPAGNVHSALSLVMAPHSSWWPGEVWDTLLGASTGGVGPLGVREDQREQGIGLALAAHVTEALQQRRVQTSYVGWTWLAEWYGHLGYCVWNECVMARQQL